jgi:hypothetical protein
VQVDGIRDKTDSAAPQSQLCSVPSQAPNNTNQRIHRWRDDNLVERPAGEAIQDCGFGVLEVWQAQDRFCDVRFIVSTVSAS